MERKVDKYLKEGIKFCLNQLKTHKTWSDEHQTTFLSCYFFNKSVDPTQFPDYYEKITNPIDLGKINKNLDTSKYSISTTHSLVTNVVNILKDMDLLRDNCNLYNQGEINQIVRQYAEGLRHYFRYLMRIIIRLLQHAPSDPILEQFLTAKEIVSLLKEYDDVDVLLHMNITGEQIIKSIEESTLLKSSGFKVPANLIQTKLFEITEIRLAPNTKIPKISLPNNPLPPAKGSKSVATTLKEPVVTLSTTTATPTPTTASSKSNKRNSMDALLSVDSSSYDLDSYSQPPSNKRARPSESSLNLVRSTSSASNLNLTTTATNTKKGRKSEPLPSLPSYNLPSDDASETILWADDFEDLNSIASVNVPSAKPATKSRKSTNTTANNQGNKLTTQNSKVSLASSSQIPETTSVNSINPSIAVLEYSWYEGAHKVMKAISSHPYVDPMKSSTCIADFFHPVLESCAHLPNFTESYLSIIAEPMDLGTLLLWVDTQQLQTADEFMRYLLLVFQNAADYNIRTPLENAQRLAQKSQYLLTYAKALCYEYLPMNSLETMTTTTKSKSQILPQTELVPSIQQEIRIAREKLLQTIEIRSMIDTRYAYQDCERLIKDVTRARNKSEQDSIDWFWIPIIPTDEFLHDYLVYVQKPMDISTLQYKLSGKENPNVQLKEKHLLTRYQTYGEFLSEFRMIFNNSKVYNGQHMTDSPEDISRKLYNVAEALLMKLEGLIPMFTLSLIDRYTIHQFKYEDIKKEEQTLELKRQEELQRLYEEKELERKMFEKAMQENPELLRDLDYETKKKETEIMLKKQQNSLMMDTILANKQAMHGDDTSVHDISSPEMSPEYGQYHASRPLEDGKVELIARNLRISGFGELPLSFHHMIEKKLLCRKKAWDYWLPEKKTDHTIAPVNNAMNTKSLPNKNNQSKQPTATTTTNTTNNTLPSNNITNVPVASSQPRESKPPVVITTPPRSEKMDVDKGDQSPVEPPPPPPDDDEELPPPPPDSDHENEPNKELHKETKKDPSPLRLILPKVKPLPSRPMIFCD